MTHAHIFFDIHSFWHAGSGEGRGGDVDASPLRSRAGLPFLPGRTVKGLFREAVQLAEDADQLPAHTTSALFGSPAQSAAHNDSAHPSSPGCLSFSDATLGKDFELWAAASHNKPCLSGLFHVLSSTRIDKHGMAQDKTLRRIEVAVPMQLTATVSLIAQPPGHNSWFHVLATAAPLIRSLGSLRHRGLGRVSVTLRQSES